MRFMKTLKPATALGVAILAGWGILHLRPRAPVVPTVTVYGGAGEVAGSLSILQVGSRSWMIDCGAYYPDGDGTAEEREQRAAERTGELPANAAGVAGVLITHAHLDHIGRLPLLVRGGYRQPIHVTPGTAAIAPTMLRMQIRYNGHRLRNWKWSAASEDGDKPVVLHWADCKWSDKIRRAREWSGRLTDLDQRLEGRCYPCKVCGDLEASRVVRLFEEHPYGRRFQLGAGVGAVFVDAGHIPGSATIVFDVTGSDGSARFAFSGDLGNHLSTLFKGPDPLQSVDMVFVETTYGAEVRSPDTPQQFEEFRQRIGEVVRARGIAWVPAFALDRTQKILHQISIAKSEGALDVGLPVYCPSPSAREISEIYRSAAKAGRGWFRRGVEDNPSVFSPPGLVESAPEGDPPVPSVLITTSGMLDAAFSEALLPELIGDATTGVFLVGWQDPMSPGGRLRAGAKFIESGNKRVSIRAAIHNFGCFSGHGDAKDIDNWLAELSSDATVVLVHGDPRNLVERKADLHSKGKADVRIAARGESIIVPLKD